MKKINSKTAMKIFLMITAYMIAIGVCWLDFNTHETVDFYFFYFISIMIIAYISQTPHSIIASVAFSSVLYASEQYFSHQGMPLGIMLWNIGVAMLTFSLIAGGTRGMRKKQARIISLCARLNQAYKKEKLNANTDPLTGILNRRGFEEKAVCEFERAQRYGLHMSLLYFDVDKFKTINDTHGHSMGDNILQEIASLVKTTKRAMDIFARWGGDEFILLLPHTDEEKAKGIARRIEKVIARNASLPLLVSIGIYTFTGKEGLTIDEIIKLTDSAMYRAKHEIVLNNG